MSLRLSAAAVLACLPALAAPVRAAEAPTPRWTFGALAIERDAPYRGLDEDLLVVPFVRFEGERAYLRGLRGGYVLHAADGFSFGPFVQVRGDGYDADDSSFLAGMADRRFSLDAGLAASWLRPGFGQLELSAATDVLDRSGGQEVELSYTARFAAGGWTFLPALSAKWQSADLVDYYWGVRAGEARPGRPQYRPGSAVLPELSLLATRPLGTQWSLFARVGHTWLPGAITDSPIVAGDSRTGIILGLGWSPQ